MSQPLREPHTSRTNNSYAAGGQTKSHYALKESEISDLISAEPRIESLRSLALVFLREVEALKGLLAPKQARKRGEPIDLEKEMAAIEAGLIKWALMNTGGNQAAAAKLLSINATTLHSKMKRHGIKADDRFLAIE
jgi:DNA-binding NtrC family response regulator